MRDDIWLSDKDYPEAKDIEAFGDDSPPDDDPLTIGYVGNNRRRFWTGQRLLWLVVILFMIGALLVPLLLVLRVP